jgi:amino acid adenylation domain-containing protein
MIATKLNLQQSNSHNLFANKIYWLNKLSGELHASNIQADYLIPLGVVNKDRSFKFELPISLSSKIIRFTDKSDFSIYIVLLAAWKILLQKYTRNNNIIVGSPSYYQFELLPSKDTAKIIPLRSTINRDLTFKSFLLELENTIIEAYIHQNCSFDEIYHLLKIEEKYDLYSVFNTVFLLKNIHNQEINKSNYPLTVSCFVNNDRIGGTVKYSTELFEDKTIGSIIKTYLNIIDSIINNINIKISEINFLNKEQRKHLLEKFNHNEQNYLLTKSIDRLFEEQVQQTPNRVAAVEQEASLTYEQLNNQANQLAKLLENVGVKSGDFVVILKDRDLNFLIGILAILKVGGVYVPIDSTYPEQRIKYMLSNSEARFLLTDSISLQNCNQLLSDSSYLQSVVCLDIKSKYETSNKINRLKIYSRKDFERLAEANLGANHTGIAPAYMLYTSGSTGSPKGAIVRHDGAVNHIYAQFDALKLDRKFAFLQSAPSSTDISVWQFLAPLLIGGKTVIVDSESGFVPEKLLRVLQQYEITIVELVPVVLGGLLDYVSQLPIQQRALPELKWMMVVGEPVSVKRVNQWLSIYPHIKVADAYGPTEAADDITQYIIDQPLPENQRTVPIGKPLANLNIYIVDEEMKVLPIGVPGEICVSGIGVGDGYWKNEEKTKQAFVDNPFLSQLLSPQNHDVIYKTGDLGRWLTDGNIEFLGRIDHQVKIRGFRVELGEIKAFLSQHSNVREAVVIVREDNPDDKRLVAYVVPNSELHQDDLSNSELVQELRDFLVEKLPMHMVPSGIVLIDAVPLAPSGKVDRRALPIPNFQNELEVGFVAPRTPTEEIVADIWSQVLKQEYVGIHDNFFNLGGHSLLATQVVAKLREAFNLELPLRSLFETPTVAQLVEHIERMLTVQKLQLASKDATDQKYEEIEL